LMEHVLASIMARTPPSASARSLLFARDEASIVVFSAIDERAASRRVFPSSHSCSPPHWRGSAHVAVRETGPTNQSDRLPPQRQGKPCLRALAECARLAQRRLKDNRLIRVSVGLEDQGELSADLRQALDA
jgi:hypothetical protein